MRGWPRFSEAGSYSGPLPSSFGHRHKKFLAAIAHLICNDLSARHDPLFGDADWRALASNPPSRGHLAQADLNDTSSWVYVPFAVVVESERSEVLERYSRFLTATAAPRACHMMEKKLLCHCLVCATCHTDRIIEECKLSRLAEPTWQLVDRGSWKLHWWRV